MSPSKVDGARAWISSQLKVVGCSTSPLILNVHVSVDSLGVASAVSTGQAEPTSYWPGGRRRSRVASPRPRNPLVNLIAPVLFVSLSHRREAFARAVAYRESAPTTRDRIAARLRSIIRNGTRTAPGGRQRQEGKRLWQSKRMWTSS